MKQYLLFILFLISSCTYDKLSVCETDNPSFSECVEPIFMEHCVVCHFPENPDGILYLSYYLEIRDQVLNGNVIESIKRDVDYMPKGGSKLSAEQILIIENWKDNGAPNN